MCWKFSTLYRESISEIGYDLACVPGITENKTFHSNESVIKASNVVLQITRQQESLLTLVAGVRLNSGMKQHVAFQHGRRDERRSQQTHQCCFALALWFVRL